MITYTGTIISLLVAVASFLLALWGLIRSEKTNRARLWLEIRAAFATHDAVHRNLRPGGAWGNGQEPTTSDEFAKIEAYMGLFEHCEIMLAKKLIDKATFRDIYCYRLQNLIANKWVRERKLRDEEGSWSLFHRLLRRMALNDIC